MAEPRPRRHQTCPSSAYWPNSIKNVRQEQGEIKGAPYWSEAPFLINQLNVPTVYFAPGDIRSCHTLEERVELEEYFDGIIALAAFLARIGSLESSKSNWPASAATT